MFAPCKLAASLICADMLDLGTEVERLERGQADHIHLDVMDGVFVPRYGLPPEVLSAVRKRTSIPVDVHLMVADPEPYIDTFVRAGADIVTFHIESTMHASRVIGRIRQAGARAGVALNPATSPNVLEWIAEDLALVLVMAINPGIVGHRLIPGMIAKITQVRDLVNGVNPTCIVEVDGGVTFESAPRMVAAGADMLVCGNSTIFRPDRPVDKALRDLRASLRSASPRSGGEP